MHLYYSASYFVYPLHCIWRYTISFRFVGTFGFSACGLFLSFVPHSAIVIQPTHYSVRNLAYEYYSQSRLPSQPEQPLHAVLHPCINARRTLCL